LNCHVVSSTEVHDSARSGSRFPSLSMNVRASKIVAWMLKIERLSS
jgi:hypothetical protein